MRRNITTWIKPFHAIPNEVAVPSPFGIYPPDEKLGYHETPLISQYGERIEMRISGRKLNIKDQDIFIALTEIATEQKTLKFTTSLNELCRKLKRPYAKTSKQSIKNSLRRLREALVETVSFDGDSRKEENANWIIHGMISFAAGNRKDQLKIELDDSFNRLFGKRLLMTLFDSQFRLSLKGGVSKQLYLFYQRQISAKQRSTYPIGIEKLCGLIGLDINQRLTLPTKRYQIKKGCEELINKGYLKAYNLKANDVLVVTFDKKWLKGRKQLAESKPEAAKPEEKTNPTPPLIKKSEQKNGLLGYLEKEVGIKIEKNVELAEENIIKIQAIGKALGAYEFFNKFVSWIKEQHDSGDGWLKSIHASTLNPENNVFTRFMGYTELKMPSANAIDKYFKLITETPDEKEQRQSRERKEKEKKEHEDREYQADIKWAQNYTKDNLKNLSEKDIDEVKQMIRHGKNWKESFKEFVQAVKKKHKAGKGERNCSYYFLFKAGSRLWNDIFEPEIEPEIEDGLEDLLEDHIDERLNECDVM